MLKRERELPRWEVCDPEDIDCEGSWRGIRAHNAEDAAERWAEREDGEEYVYYGDGNVGHIAVRKSEGHPVQVFAVSGSVSYYYSAEAVEMPKGEEE